MNEQFEQQMKDFKKFSKEIDGMMQGMPKAFEPLFAHLGNISKMSQPKYAKDCLIDYDKAKVSLMEDNTIRIEFTEPVKAKEYYDKLT